MVGDLYIFKIFGGFKSDLKSVSKIKIFSKTLFKDPKNSLTETSSDDLSSQKVVFATFQPCGYESLLRTPENFYRQAIQPFYP
jgi:hypothetical protein